MLKELTHGTINAYRRWGCRCNLCVMENRYRSRKDMAAWYQRRMADRAHREHDETGTCRWCR